MAEKPYNLDGYVAIPAEQYEAMAAACRNLLYQWKCEHHERCGRIPSRSHSGHCFAPFPKELEKLKEFALDKPRVML